MVDIAPPITKAVDPTEKRIAEVAKHSVRQFSESTFGGMLGDTVGFLWGARPDLMPPWGTLECDIALRVMHYNQHNAIWSGGAEAYIEKFQSIPYEISGGRNLTFKWQDVFFDAEFGQGYDELMIPCLVDYLTLNRGFFIEKVSYGDSDTPIREGAKILGLNHLDALRMTFTGNREWPYLYQSEYYGGWHKMHYSRVIHVARQPSPDTRMLGIGKSALYDSLTVANSEILLGRHENEMLNDLPPPGIVIFNNVKADEVQTVMTQFQYDRVRDGQNTFRAPVQMSSFDPSQPATVTFVPLATVPQGFDKEKYTQIHVNTYALNLGLDPQDIWPLSAGAMGSGAQSKVLAAKTDIKGPGYLSTRMTRVWNVTLPESLEWKYKAQNAQQDREIAELAKMWVDTAMAAQGAITEGEIRQLLANQMPSFADVLLDESGQVRLFDNDPKTVEQVTATDEVVLEPTDADEVTTNSENETVMTEEVGQPVVKPDAQTTALAIAKPKQPAVAEPTAPASTPAPAPVSKPTSGVVIDDQFKKINDQLKAGLITIAQAQEKLGLPRDAIYEGMYIIDGYPTPRTVIPKLYESKFGRGVASFGAVLTGETMPTGMGAGPVPSEGTPAAKELPVRKEIDATNDAFIQEMTAIIQDGIDRTITKAGTASRIRGAINRYGKSAYIDGLEDTGVDGSDLSEDDNRIISDIALHPTQFVTDLVKEIFSESGMTGTPESRAPMWTKSLQEFYEAGRASGDANGIYEWQIGNTEKHCKSCKRMNGQKHRMKDYIRKEIIPQCSALECGGYHCDCKLVKSKGKSSGNWL